MPIPTCFGMSTWDFNRKDRVPNYQVNGCGMADSQSRYYNGALLPGWQESDHYIGTPSQWLNGSVWGVDQPLVWQGGFSSNCKQASCACPTTVRLTGPCYGRASAIWQVQTPSFAGLSATPIAWMGGTNWTSQAVQPGPQCLNGTAAAWSVVPPYSWAGLSSQCVPYVGSGVWNTCCEG
jgi:hypothetical protein